MRAVHIRDHTQAAPVSAAQTYTAYATVLDRSGDAERAAEFHRKADELTR